MSIIFDPKAILKKIAPAKKIEKLVSKNLTLKKSALSFVDDIDVINKKDVTTVALKVINSYQDRFHNALDEGDASDLKSAIIDDPALLVNRVQGEIIFQIHAAVKEKYSGETAVWLPSDAMDPRPEHQLNYGKVYIIGEGIDGVEPGDEYGCQCGMEIQVDETQLSL